MIKYINYLDITSPSIAVRRRMDRTIDLARISTMSQKHGAILYSGGRLIAVGVNTYRNAIGSGVSPEFISNHAEINCLGGLSRSSGTLYVARVSKGGNVSHSAPCRACRKFLEFNTGISKVIHT